MIEKYLGPDMFKRVYSTITQGTPEWQALETSDSRVLYDWRDDSTYIHNPPFFKVRFYRFLLVCLFNLCLLVLFC